MMLNKMDLFQIYNLRQGDLVLYGERVYLVNLQFDPQEVRLHGKKLLELYPLFSDGHFIKSIWEKWVNRISIRMATDLDVEQEMIRHMSYVDLTEDVRLIETEDSIHLSRKKNDFESMALTLEEARDLRDYLNRRLG